ncbi:hypothetical protein [Rhizobium hidalgonense]|uniref:hypothetical protein n=1 Tax=Rhizobium hidalgonense TaxID=1538159 RepID=UPI0013FD6000|nr:hypothetical protein [Rhizobium hidalgonense]MDR9813263.1 hypothetical protein [Rhizobium hidalgonense]
MDTDFPIGKANWHCDRVEIHCGTHPVESMAGNLGNECVQFKAGNDYADGSLPLTLTLSP